MWEIKEKYEKENSDLKQKRLNDKNIIKNLNKELKEEKDKFEIYIITFIFNL